MEVLFFFGPGSRYSYLAATQIPTICARSGARFRWAPVLSSDLVARTGGSPRSPQDPSYRTTDVERWSRHYGVPFHDIDAEIDWRRWAIACAAAQRLESAEPFATRLYARAYGRGRPPRNDTALTEIAVEAGLSGKDFSLTLEDPQTEATYEANVRSALAYGAFGVPTFVTADGALFWGQDRLPLLVDHLIRMQAESRIND